MSMINIYRIQRSAKWLIRRVRWIPYRAKYGFWPSDLWSLDSTIAKFVYPRLKEFAKARAGRPFDEQDEEWTEKLNKMIYAFDKARAGWDLDKLSEEERDKVNEGLYLFYERFFNLWS